MSPPLILTLKLDQSTFELLNELRQQHFPRERNFIPAHVTLFHALPSQEESFIYKTLQAQCKHISQLPFSLPTVRFLGRGVAVNVDCPKLIQIKNQLNDQWLEWLTSQDRQPYKPHVTIQNKVNSEEARQLYDRLSQSWQPRQGFATGLLLWRYKGGPWDFVHEFLFDA